MVRERLECPWCDSERVYKMWTINGQLWTCDDCMSEHTTADRQRKLKNLTFTQAELPL